MSDATTGEAAADGEATPTASANDGDSIGDLAQQPIVTEWATFLATLFALIGVGVGLMMILGDAVGEPMFKIDTGDFGVGSVSMDVGLGMPPQQAMYWAMPAAVLVGAVVSWRLPADDTSAMLAAAMGTGAGTAVLVIVAAFLSSIAMDGVSLDFGGVLINGIVAGLVAAIVAGAAAWVVRNRAPDVDFGGPTLE